MLSRRALAILLTVGLLLAGCGFAVPQGDSTSFDTKLTADLAPGDARAVGNAVNAFGFDLLGEITGRGAAAGTKTGVGREGPRAGKNTVISPLSVAVLLAMVLAGADGDTAKAMADVLHLDDSRDVRVGALLRRLTDTDDVTVSVGNALWADDKTTIRQDYRDFLRDTFDATVESADLGRRGTAEEIDAWVADQTRGRIQKIAKSLGLPNPRAVLALVNAVYFRGEWTTRFDPADTRSEPFTLSSGRQVNVPMMQLRGARFGYADRDGYRMLRLPYGESGRYGMEVLLPDEGVDLATVLGSLDAREWRAATEHLAERTVHEVALPRFELRWSAELRRTLTALGMGAAFRGEADFRPMSPANPHLDTVVHKTYIKVNEKGTEAAAVSGGEMTTTSVVDQLEFRVDQPFVFTISDTMTGTILFLGTVDDPRR